MSMDLLFSEPISKLSDAVIYAARTTANFKTQLQQIKNTLDRITPIIVEIQNQNLKLHRTNSEQVMFIDELEIANKLVHKCSTIKNWNLYLKFTHSLKLKDVDQKLLRFFGIEVQAVQLRKITETLAEVIEVNERLTKHMGEVSDSGGSITVSSGGEHVKKRGSIERKRLGWPVPSLPRGVVGFHKPLKELKAKVLSDINLRDDDDDDDDDCVAGKVVVVSAPGGSGKTTMVKLLSNDPQIQDHFGENVFFVTVSETPDFMLSVNDLINPNSFNQQVKFQGCEDAKIKLETFLLEKVSGHILLVLDDVWDESYIKNFEFDIKGYKLLVTSRKQFKKYDVFKFDPLSDEDANVLFRKSARPIPTIDENLVDQMVKCCKKHPLTLSVVGSSLNGKDEVVWKYKLKSLSQGQSVLDLNQEVLNRLERSFEDLEKGFKQCYLDFGLFPEDKQITARVLLDMWVHLYNHDEEGIDTLAKIYELSYRNLVDVMTQSIFNNSHDTDDCCKDQFVTQHDLLRQLSINLNSKLPIAKRPRLIISAQNDVLMTNVQGEDNMTSIEQMQEPMQARILSISTGMSFSSRWRYLRVPEVEVMVMNISSQTYTLPPFLKEMQKLMILNVTNHGFRSTNFEDFHLLGCLSNLTRIRFERVAIPSLSRSTLALVNLQKVSFIRCHMAYAFEEPSIDNLNVWPRLVEIEMDLCSGLKVYPRILCSSVYLRKISIRYCELSEISEEFGNLTSLEALNINGCSFLERLPESITRLQKLSTIHVSYCLSLKKLPEQMGSLGGLRTIYMIGVKGVHELPASVKDLSNTKVVCNEELARLWKEFPNVEVNVVEEDYLLKLLLGMELNSVLNDCYM